MKLCWNFSTQIASQCSDSKIEYSPLFPQNQFMVRKGWCDERRYYLEWTRIEVRNYLVWGSWAFGIFQSWGDASRWVISQKSGICLWKWRYGVFHRRWASWFTARPRFTMGQPSEISASCRAIESGFFFCRCARAPLWKHCSIQMRWTNGSGCWSLWGGLKRGIIKLHYCSLRCNWLSEAEI